ncbi:zinc finger and BTB domain-containing protein 24 isoform X2 [Folsomia candida]|uniref:zinc finger and BTB domain-containing protein 24 isoform X2 n=1 Tax=Folsomia candida TaxID=158441 RepID=UPI001604E108|nr:zinc finger and BTB domain-containing protein 24 isoform X2 [Folsomia candida]
MEEGHPQDAYELGRAAVTKLKEHDEQLSLQLPKALKALFSDTEFQDAIMVSGVTNQRQRLTPIASYQVASSVSSSSSGSSRPTTVTANRMITRTARRGRQRYISSTSSPTPSKTSLQHTSDTAGSVTQSSIQEIALEYVDDERAEKVVAEDRIKPVKKRKTVKRNQELETGSQTQTPNPTVIPQIEGDPVETINDGNTVDYEDKNCLCCDELLNCPKEAMSKESTKTSDANPPNNLFLRDLLWLSLGMQKFYDRTSLSFPFCENCSLKIRKLYDICKQVEQLEVEFNEIRVSLCEGIVSNHFKMTKAAAASGQQVQLKSKVLKRIEKEVSEVLPGSQLLKQVSRFVDSKSQTNADDQSNVDESIGPVETSPSIECRICDKTFTSQAAIRSHERIHKSKGQFGCNVCGKTFITNRNLIYHTKIHKEKSHKCQFCDKKFSCSGNLKDHIRRHVGFRPFQCTICLERYFVMKHVRAHFLKRHPDMNVAKNVKKILQHNSSAI